MTEPCGAGCSPMTDPSEASIIFIYQRGFRNLYSRLRQSFTYVAGNIRWFSESGGVNFLSGSVLTDAYRSTKKIADRRHDFLTMFCARKLARQLSPGDCSTLSPGLFHKVGEFTH